MKFFLKLCGFVFSVCIIHICVAQTSVSTRVLIEPVISSAERKQLIGLADAALSQVPDPLEVVHTEGTLPSLERFKRAAQSKRDWAHISNLSIAFAVTQERRYLEHYELYLKAWLSVYRISGNPIDETDLAYWLLAYRTAGDSLSQSTRQAMLDFSCKLSSRYQSVLSPRIGISINNNNWQSHRVKLAMMGAYICQKDNLKQGAQRLFKQQIEDNLMPSGPSIDFAQRDAIDYVVYSLEPLVEAILFAQFYEGVQAPVIGSQGQSLARSLSWLLPYATGVSQHEEFVRTTVRFDRERLADGAKGFSGLFEPKKATFLFWLASQLDPQWKASSEKMETPWIVRRFHWLYKTNQSSN